MRKAAVIAGFAAVIIAVGLYFTFPIITDLMTGSTALRPLTSQVRVGDGVRIEVEVADAASRVSVNSARLDMGPDGMETMTAPLRPVESPRPNVVAFETDIIMAGRWALTITANVEGRSRPVTGRVVLTAVEAPETGNAQASSAKPRDRKILYYRNPMGLPDVSPIPKKDSMGMDYIPVYADEAAGPDGSVSLSPEKIQRTGVRTALVESRSLSRTIRAPGTIVADESRLSSITPKFSGFIEELFVPVTGAEVRAGQPLIRVWIESAEILQKQADLITAFRGTARAGDVQQTEQNLRLFGISDQVLEQLRRSNAPIRSIVLTAPIRGTVLQKPAVVGMRFGPGDTLFRVADLSVVWVLAQIPERDLSSVKQGQPARVTVKAYPDRALEGRVTFIYPELDLATRTAQARIELKNPDGLLKTGLYADVSIESAVAARPVLAVPDSAVIDNGTRRVAFVAKDNGRFEPRDLVLGARADGNVEVKEGLAEGERVVVSGNFLIDAESNLRAALSAFSPASPAR